MGRTRYDLESMRALETPEWVTASTNEGPRDRRIVEDCVMLGLHIYVLDNVPAVELKPGAAKIVTLASCAPLDEGNFARWHDELVPHLEKVHGFLRARR